MDNASFENIYSQHKGLSNGKIYAKMLTDISKNVRLYVILFHFCLLMVVPKS